MAVLRAITESVLQNDRLLKAVVFPDAEAAVFPLADGW